MKKVGVFLLVIIISTSANAQLGIVGGVNSAKYKYTSDRKAILAFNLGVLYRKPIGATDFSLQPSFTLTGKGAVKYSDPYGPDPVMKYKNHINYLQLTLPVLYSINVSEFADDLPIKIDVGMGPYLAYCVSAKYKGVRYDDGKVNGNYKIGNKSTDDFKRTDAGVSIVLAAKFPKLSVGFQYDLGLANVNPTAGQSAIKMRSFSLNAAYFINNK